MKSSYFRSLCDSYDTQYSIVETLAYCEHELHALIGARVVETSAYSEHELHAFIIARVRSRKSRRHDEPFS